MTKVTVLFMLCALFVVTLGKHVHPRSVLYGDIPDETQIIPVAIDGMQIEMFRHIKPTRFVPVNNAISFQKYPPCEDGFERDLVGVCREVWD